MSPYLHVVTGFSKRQSPDISLIVNFRVTPMDHLPCQACEMEEVHGSLGHSTGKDPKPPRLVRLARKAGEFGFRLGPWRGETLE